MIEPTAFGYNPQTSVNNHFQNDEDKNNKDVQQRALTEFTAMVEMLRANGVDVITVKDTPYPHTPDSIFPNNWISFHIANSAVFYPMFAENRRLERRMDVLLAVENHRKANYEFKDYSHFEKNGQFLEGTGSMVFDRENRVAYAALSPRTDKTLFLDFCRELNFHPVFFNATQQVGDERLAIYHTNVMMCIADTYAVVCLNCVQDKKEREELVKTLKSTGKEIVEISEEQMNQFAGNMLQVKNKQGEKLLVMSQTAYNSLNQNQIHYLQSQNKILTPAIPTIEKNGGGSVRCMMAEVF